ncbi:AAA family ATPase [Coleofasciculus sp. E1-EBD-02]|uniref:AAA family ATPase n=1 Tax=Coleofasciculus sp. E1-EBD-02 TaxID=3068481 RepID=UPI0032F8BF47
MSILEDELLEKLIRLSSEQFQAVVFRLKDDIEEADLPGSTASQSDKAIELIRLLELQDKLQLLESTLESAAIKKLSLQSPASLTKVQVDQIVSDNTKLFVGRDDEEQQLDNFLTENSSGMLLVRADAGMGKTALLANWKQKQQQQGNCFIAYHFFRQGQEISDVIKAYRHLLQQLYTYYELTTPQIPSDQNNPERIFQLLQEPLKRPDGKPLIILLDALDEASPERSLSQFLPQPLPEGLYVIASVRVNEAEKLDNNLPSWIQVTKEVHLKHLPSPAIKDWLRRAGNGELATLAEDETLVAQVCDRTEGIPLFLKYLIDELVQVAKQGEESAIRKTLEATPKGFTNYIRQQYQALDRLEDWSRLELQKIFYFLTIAKGELSSEDLVELMDNSPQRLPWQVSRWFKIRESEDCFLYSFAHPSLAERFAALPAIKANTKKAQKELINYCAHWQEYHSAYALRHYAEHLRDVKRWEELYAIARNPDFASTQRQQLPDEPDLPLKTVQTALQGAADTDDAGAMAEFLLANAQRIMRQESPLDVLRSGNLKRALALADMYESERSVLWYLLLAWELKDKNKVEEAHRLLKQLLKKELPHFSIHFFPPGKWVIYLLTQICQVDEDTFTILYKRILPAKEYYDLCICLSSEGYLEIALKTVQEIDCSRKPGISSNSIPEVQTEIQARDILNVNSWYQVKALVAIAKAYFEAGDREAARATLSTAMETADKIDSKLNSDAERNLAEVLQQIASTRAEIGDITDALITAQKIPINVFRLAAIEEIVEKQVKNHQLDAALKLAHLNDMPALESWIFRINSRTEWQSGNIEKAQFYLREALQKVERIKYKLQQIDEFLRIALLQNNLEIEERLEKVEAIIVHTFEISRGIEEQDIRVTALARIAQAIKELGETDRARLTFNETLDYTIQNITNTWEITKSLGIIIHAQVEVGQLSEALKNLKKIPDQWQQANIQKGIALGQAKVKEFKVAIDIARSIKERKVRSEAIGEIAIEQAQAEKTAIPLETAQEVDFMERRSIRLEIAKILYSRGYRQEARTIFSEFLQASHIFDNQQAQIAALIDVAVAQAQIGDRENAQHAFATAQQVTNTIEDRRFQVMELCSIAMAQIQVGDKQEAEITFATADQIAQSIQSETDRSFALEELAKIRLKLKNFDVAFKTACSIRESRTRNAVLEEIAVTHAEYGDFDTAFEVLQSIGFKEYRERVIKEIKYFQITKEFLAQLKLGNVTAALEIVQKIESIKLQAKALIKIAESQTMRSQTKAALAILADALRIAKKVNEGYDTEAIEAVILAQAEIDTLPNCLESVKTIYSAYKQAEIVGKIARLKTKNGQNEEIEVAFSVALKTAQEIDSESIRSHTLGNIAKELVQAGFIDQAIKTLKMIRTERNWQLPEIAAAFVEKGDKTNFKQLLIPCSYSLYAAHRMCGHLARLYPEKAAKIQKLLSGFD